MHYSRRSPGMYYGPPPGKRATLYNKRWRGPVNKYSKFDPPTYTGGNLFTTVINPKRQYTNASWAKDDEVKYFDKAIESEPATLKHSPQTSSHFLDSSVWQTVNHGISDMNNFQVEYQQDLLKGVPQGSTASSRVGNVINVKNLQGHITFTANTINVSLSDYKNAQYGESTAASDEQTHLKQFLRTTYRYMIVRDMQVNSLDKQIKWSDVMDQSWSTGMAGVHSFPDVKNMRRFKVLVNRIVNLDATDPSKTVSYTINGVGRIRYNGPSGGTTPALTDNGIYIIWSCLSTATPTTETSSLSTSGVYVSNRITYTDN